MCARFTLGKEQAQLERRFDLPSGEVSLTPRFNLAPGQDAALVIVEPHRRLALMRWGLIPAWAKDPKAGHRPINARAETLAAQPLFRGPLRHRRALVPADGFYEWRPGPKGGPKQPYLFRRADHEPFAMAGLWDAWASPQGEALRTFTIVTTRANHLVDAIHDRMPAMLLPEHEAAWLDPEQHDPAKLLPLLAPYPPELMRAHPVSPRMNRVGVEGPELIRPVEPGKKEIEGGLF